MFPATTSSLCDQKPGSIPLIDKTRQKCSSVPHWSGKPARPWFRIIEYKHWEENVIFSPLPSIGRDLARYSWTLAPYFRPTLGDEVVYGQ